MMLRCRSPCEQFSPAPYLAHRIPTTAFGEVSAKGGGGSLPLFPFAFCLYYYFKISFILCVWMFCLHVCLCTMYPGIQKRAVNPLDWSLDDCEPPCGSWVSPRSSGRTVCALNPRAASPVLPPVHVVYETLFLFQAPSVARKDDLVLWTSLPLPSEG